jgi:YrhK-like protein
MSTAPYSSTPATSGSDSSLRLPLGHDEVVINDRYETLSIANDVLIALFFLVGSVLFFFDSTQTIGTWLFLLGSLEFLARPAIRLTRRIHLKRIGATTGRRGTDYDY